MDFDKILEQEAIKTEAQATQQCSECGSESVVIDHSSGDTVCSQCGLVLESHMIDSFAEWRNYTNEDGSKDSSKQRTSLYVNQLFPHSSSGTTFLSNDPKFKRMKQLSQRSNIPYHEKMLMEVRNDIQTHFADLPVSVQKEAICLYKNFKNTVNGRTGKIPINRAGNRRGVIAACIRKACFQRDIAITDKILAQKFKCTLANIGYGIKILEQHLRKSSSDVQCLIANADPKTFIEKYCSSIGLPRFFMNRVNELADTVMTFRSSNQKLHSSRPSSMAAGCLWYAIKQAGLDVPHDNHPGYSKQFIKEITSVSEATISQLFDIICVKMQNETNTE